MVGALPPGVQVPGFDLEAVPDLVSGGGALGGLVHRAVGRRSPHVLVLACDLPFVSRVFLRHLAALPGPAHDAVVPRSHDGWQPLCAVYRRDLAAGFGERVASGRLKVADALAELRVREVGPAEIASVEPDERLFLNVNTPRAPRPRDPIIAQDEPMILPVHDAIRRRITAAVQGLYGLAAGEVPAFPIDYPPTRDSATSPSRWRSSWRGAFARRRKPSPRRLAAALVDLPGVARVEATPAAT